MQLFISYKREDETFAVRLRDQLHTHGFATWMDIFEIDQGAYWPDEIDKGLQASQVVVGLLTPESVASRNVKNEWDWALANGKRLLLLMVRQCNLPHRYVSINYINFMNSEEQGFANLKAALIDPDHRQYIEESNVRVIQQTPVSPAHPSTGDANRTRMLEKVRSFWIEGVLEKSIQDTMLIDLGMEHQPESVLQHSDYPQYALPTGTRIGTVFEDVGRELLILGAPGSGKTTMLLELARDLLTRAETNDSQPMPVVFNLSSWGLERKTLAAWMIDELNTRYQVPVRIGKLWVENGKILVLLDGLDEVKFEYRDDCVEIINQFRTEYSFVDLAVCSRVADYEMLSNRLRLRTAIVLQPLTPTQVEAFLARLGTEVDALRSVLQTDAPLREEARSPLMLNIMTVAYRNMPARALSGYTTLEARRKHMFENYVERRFKQDHSPDYTLRQTIHWLSWLARRMVQQSQTVFYIERIQPDWLPVNVPRPLYAILIGVVLALFIGLGFGLPFGIFVTLYEGAERGIRSGVTGGVILAMVFGLVAFLLGRWSKIRVIETLNWSWWQALAGFGIGTIGGLFLSLIFRTSVFRLPLVLALGIPGAVTGGFITREIEMKTSPNQGIRRSARMAVLIGIIMGIIVSIAFGVATTFSVIQQESQSVLGLVNFTLFFGVTFGVIMGVASGMLFGGFTFLQHCILRWFLARTDCTPLNYAQFLDYASGRVLLRQVGGGYIFRHRLLLEYFAGLESNSSAAK